LAKTDSNAAERSNLTADYACLQQITMNLRVAVRLSPRLSNTILFYLTIKKNAKLKYQSDVL